MKTKRTAVLITLAAIGLLVLAAVHSLRGSAREATAKNTIHCLVIASQTYAKEYGKFPTGTFSQVCQALGGDNSLKTAFIEVAPDHIQRDGAILDPWGSPYRLDFGSASNVVAYSAGTDLAWGTEDDITSK